MNPLALDLDDRSFDQLLEAARSRLPALAPAWTDYNAHDPGITLIELLAWTAEAQIYSLARMRGDERAAYARLLGAPLAGPRPAGGLIWPDLADRSHPLNVNLRPLAIAPAAVIHPLDADRPIFHARWPTLLVPGRLTGLHTRLAGGATIDHGATNARGAVAFEPFGPEAGPRDVLVLSYDCADEDGLAARKPQVLGARLAIGVRVDGDTAGDDDFDTGVPLEATLVCGQVRITLAVASDDTRGWLRSGALALALPEDLPASQRFALEIRAPRGFLRPPRVRQIALNAVPVLQLHRIDGESHAGTGLADQRVMLEHAGLAGTPAAEVAEGSALVAWTAVRDLAGAGPGDRVYRVEGGALHFGNGVNGRVPARDAPILVGYDVCDGASGNQPRPRAWFAEGLGPIGCNLDPLSGGGDADQLLDARRLARRQLRERHPLVSVADLRAAALKLGTLQVARAWVLPPAPGQEPGTLTLLALRRRALAAAQTEPRRWLEAIRRALTPRLPLGLRLVVRAPRYADFSVAARLTVAPLRSPAEVEKSARAELAERLSLVPSPDGRAPRELGEPLTAQELGAWLRRVDGVAKVDALVLKNAAGQAVETLAVGRLGLPRFDPARVKIAVERSAR
jgi:predicted phage baseplate assembly protein